MNYWLHRIKHFENVSYPLLEKGYLSIGFSDLCNAKVFENVAKKGDMEYLNEACEKAWGVKLRSRYSLWYFLHEMKKGDYVIVPSWRTFFIVQLSDDLPIMITDNNIDLPETDWNGTKLKRKKSNFLQLENEDIDIGYLRKVKIIYREIPRSEYADSALTSRMKIRITTANISDLEDNIKKAMSSFKRKEPINLKSGILEKTIDICNEKILDELNPDKYEKLVKWYFKKAGASETEIPSKNSAGKSGDVDVIATFENIRTIIYVQVKFYQGETSEWAIEQIKDFAYSSKDSFDDDYHRQYWVISSSETFSDESKRLARKNNILLIEGKQFVEMILNVGLDSLESFEE